MRNKKGSLSRQLVNEMDNYLFDTSFILPFCRIQIKVDNFQKEMLEVKKLFENEKKSIKLSSCSFLEAKWKAISMQKKNQREELLVHVNNAIESIVHSSVFQIIPSESISQIQALADILYSNGHSDYMDCLIFSTGKYYDCSIVSMEIEIQKQLQDIPGWDTLRFITWKEFYKNLGF